MGGGAVFFHLTPSQAFLSDMNEELINAYLQVKDDVEGLIYALKSHVNDKDYFCRIRGLNPKELSPVQRASRFIYLNKTCFNGLHRVNRSGQFNVPFGKYKNPKILDADNLRSVSKILSTTNIQVRNFENVLDVAKPGDLVYFDPPYHPTNEKSYFTEYTSVPFDKQQQELLGSVFRELDQRGCLVMLSNSYTPFIINLFTQLGYHKALVEVKAKRAINCKGNGRGQVSEVLVCNWLK
ncbi:Dam family site-specific DNA-(adenine-N6)-methyltransferase [Desulfosporosinus sp. I2]|uniref:DNA adenine methylase n=1 Tax=Desulfosporosinus sp. I2 TaxID=1617025 RepID=UPI0005EE2358|nr:Dam family site-specific DNA-(adenine-N6)-methyltransferase [Desulfosporosinus sp. I2]